MNPSILEALEAHIDTAMQKNEDTLQKAIDSLQKDETTMQDALTEIRKDMKTMQAFHQSELRKLREQHRQKNHPNRHELFFLRFF